MKQVNKYTRYTLGPQKLFKPAKVQSLGKIWADEVTSETRHDHSYGCLTDECNAVFSWVKKHRRDQNLKIVNETFRHIAGEHSKDCPWNFKQRASKYPKEVVFYKKDQETGEGYFHLRVNFPIGSSFTDRKPYWGRITTKQYENAELHTGIKSISSMGDCVKFIEKEFGSIDPLKAPQLEYLKLHYQGKDLLWEDVFTGAEYYDQIVHVPRDSGTGEPESRFAVIKINGETRNKSQKDKVRIGCEWQQRKINKRREKIKPYLTCETEELAQKIKDMDIALVSGRPFINSDIWKKYDRKNLPVTFYITSIDQITPIDSKYWRYYPAGENRMDFDNGGASIPDKSRGTGKRVKNRKMIPSGNVQSKAKGSGAGQLALEL